MTTVRIPMPLEQDVQPPAIDTLNFVQRGADRLSSQAISFLGLTGFGIAWLISWRVSTLGPSEMFALYATLTAGPMIVASLVVNRVHQRSSTGLDHVARPIHWNRCLVKLAGLSATLLVIGLIYNVLPGSIGAFYRPAFRSLYWIASLIMGGALPYFIYLDCRMAEPKDAYWHVGSAILGRWRLADWKKVKEHVFEWLVKGFFLPFMFIGTNSHLKILATRGIDFSAFDYFYQTTLNLILTIDICFGAIGYLLTMRVLDGHIRSTEPTFLGWASAVICYAPFGPMIWGEYLHYQGRTDWQDWLISRPVLYITWGLAIILLLAIYTWATCSFGYRFSNLTNRGIVVDGPYRYVKHPAYLTKNVAWWLISVPFVSHGTLIQGMLPSFFLLITNGVYFIRARTEERHLRSDPAYVVYEQWIEKYGLIAQFRKSLSESIEKAKTFTVEDILWGSIFIGTLFRVFLCIEHNPLDYIFSDASRHWSNGEKFLHPDLMGKCDPVVYQIFVFIVQRLTSEQPLLIALIYGLLSALMPWTFYRASREFGLKKSYALILWAWITVTPSLFVIFHYIMIEAFLLPLEGVCLWMTARYLRKGDGNSFLISVFCWIIACLTKPTAIVLAIICLLYSWWTKSRSFRLAMMGIILASVLVIPNGVRTYHYLGFVAPFGSPWIPKILHKSDAKRIRIHAGNTHWMFSSPSCYIKPFDPFSSWKIHRAYSDETVYVDVQLSKGNEDWSHTYNAINRTWARWSSQLGENSILLLFSPSWPDSNAHMWDGWLNYWYRWMWAPVIFVILGFNYLQFRNRRYDLIAIMVTALILILMCQNSIDMEGRYRKPLEPLLLLNAVWLMQRYAQRKSEKVLK